MEPTFDPRALQLLHRMTETYSHLQFLKQRTVFYAATIPLQPPVPPPAGQDGSTGPKNAGPGRNGVAVTSDDRPIPDQRASGQEGLPSKSSSDPSDEPEQSGPSPGDKLTRSLYLHVARPNHLRLELHDTDPDTGKPALSEWISDGKTFWSYADEHHWYTQEPAPVKLHEFLLLQHLDTGSLELLMVLGVNPFADIRDEVESVHYNGVETVRGVPTEVVTLRAMQPHLITEVQLYIGKADLLLHRLISETIPVADEIVPGRVGDELDALIDRTGAPPPRPVEPPPQFATSETDVPPAPAPVGPVKMRSAYDNIIDSAGEAAGTDFIFEKPAGALLYEPLSRQGNVSKKKPQKLIDLFRVVKPPKKRKPKVVTG